MMKKVNSLLCFILSFVVFSSIASADEWASSGMVAQRFYDHAHRNNPQAIARMQRNGYHIDSMDMSGDTAYCLAVKKKDRRAIALLKLYGANIEHNCMRQFSEAKKLEYNKGFVWKNRYIVGGALITGGAVALAAGMGGSGGGSSGEGTGTEDSGGSGENPGDSGTPGGDDFSDGENPGDGSTPGGDEIPPVGELTYLDPIDYETPEYKKGNFLSQINASTAYSRLYGIDESGKLASYLKNVKVGVLDTGVYAANTDFANTNITGFNQDYGPCRGSDRSNCWYFENGEAIANIDGSPEDYFFPISQEDFNKWAAEYNADYDWDSNSTNFNPERPIVNGDEITNSGTMHGTHVAGIIAADKNEENMHGVAFSNVSIVAGRWDLKTPVTTAINKMVDMGAQVINMSFGTDARLLDASLLDGLAPGDLMYNDVVAPIYDQYMLGFEKIAANNVIAVMAAGNESQNNPGLFNGIPLLEVFSSSLKNLFVTVVATDSSGKLASYSNKCGVTKEYCIAAPGGKDGDFIWSTGTYNYSMVGQAGTSQATPVVSGSIALLMGAYPYLTPKQIVELIFETANKTGEYADANTYGQGMLDLGEATNPQGYLGTFGGNNVGSASERINIASSSITVPAVFKEALVSNMPKSLTAFDKYNRPFAVNFASLVRTTHSGEKNFKNDLYNFTRRQPKQTVQADGFSFGFAPSSYNNTDSGLGIIDVAYEGEVHKTSFFFAENSQYSSGSYTDKAMFNPYLSMNEAYGVESKLSFDKLGLKMGFMTGENGLYDGDEDYNDSNFDSRSYAFNTEVSYQISPKFNLSAVSGMLAEDDAMLGLNGSGALDIGDSNTFYTGLMLSWQPNAKWSFGGAYYHGWTDASDVTNSMIRTSRLASSSFALDGHYNLNKTDVIGFQISSPLRIYDGHADFNIATGRDNYSDKIYRENVRADLKPSAREYKFAMYHNREIKEDVLFKGEIAVRLNPEHQQDAETDYRAMFGLSWAF